MKTSSWQISRILLFKREYDRSYPCAMRNTVRYGSPRIILCDKQDKREGAGRESPGGADYTEVG